MPDVSETIADQSALELWRARLDEVATRLMIEGAGDGVVEDLRELGREASQLGAEECRQHAQDLAAALAAGPTASPASLLKDGLTELRTAFEAAFAAPPATPVSLGEDAELVADFLVEAREHLSQIEGQMLTLERDPSAMEVIHAVFRAFHTIKGLAGFLDFQSVQAVAHEVETLLDLARNGKLIVSSAIVDVVLESGDFLQAELAAIDRTLKNGVPLETRDCRALLSRIKALAVAQTLSSGAGNPPPVEPEAEEQLFLEEVRTDAAELTTETEPSLEPADEVKVTGIVTVAPAIPVEAAALTDLSRTALSVVAQAAPNRGLSARSAGAQSGPAKEPVRNADASSVRVETGKLDHLMDMVGEMVIAQSLIRHNQVLTSTADSRLVGHLSHLARVTAEVQRATMSMRMVPVGQLFQRIERVIRDLSRKAGKQVTLETSGAETEIDKTVAEELSDPLLHMVRNSVDHGVEPPAERLNAGKPREARILLSAYHQGGQVVIQISDDGRGLNSEKIRRKAEERRLIAPNASLSESEIYQLIFEPGFSTAERITDVSGRGVGMDVVRRNVEKLRGRIETQSTRGQGTTFLLKLPLTLAIIDGLVVDVGVERYIIPLSAVREIFRPRPDAIFTVEGRDEMVQVRQQLMPVIRLHQRLGLGLQSRQGESAEGLLVVVESESRRFCLLVDDLIGKQEVVIKSLGEIFHNSFGVSGCAVLGDGRVGLILDVDGILRGSRR